MSAPQLVTLLAGTEVIVFDASLHEAHEAQVEITDHPVEVGADISDHARVKPESVTITAIISNTPVNAAQAQRALQAAQPNAAAFSASPGNFVGVSGYAEGVYARVKKIKDDRRLSTVITGLRTYQNMVMTSLSVPRESRTGDAVEFTLGFREVRLVEIRRAQVKVAAEPKARDNVDTGKQPSKPSRERTAALTGVQALGGLRD